MSAAPVSLFTSSTNPKIQQSYNSRETTGISDNVELGKNAEQVNIQSDRSRGRTKADEHYPETAWNPNTPHGPIS